jgi:hypothetical protein
MRDASADVFAANPAIRATFGDFPQCGINDAFVQSMTGIPDLISRETRMKLAIPPGAVSNPFLFDSVVDLRDLTIEPWSPQTSTRSHASKHVATHIDDPLLDDHRIPGWVYRNFDWMDAQESNEAASADITSKDADTGIARTLPQTNELVALALKNSGYPLTEVHCSSDHDTITLSGHVARYYYWQVALEAVRRIAAGRRIEMQLEIVSVAEGDAVGAAAGII